MQNDVQKKIRAASSLRPVPIKFQLYFVHESHKFCFVKAVWSCLLSLLACAITSCLFVSFSSTQKLLVALMPVLKKKTDQKKSYFDPTFFKIVILFLCSQSQLKSCFAVYLFLPRILFSTLLLDLQWSLCQSTCVRPNSIRKQLLLGLETSHSCLMSSQQHFCSGSLLEASVMLPADCIVTHSLCLPSLRVLASVFQTLLACFRA